jgi:hypothetical protein
VGYVSAALGHVGAKATRAIDAIRAAAALDHARPYGLRVLTRVAAEAMAARPVQAVVARPADQRFVLEDWPVAAYRVWLRAFQEADLLAEAQQGQRPRKYGYITLAEALFTRTFDLAPDWIAILIQGAAYLELLDEAQEAHDRALRHAHFLANPDRPDLPQARLLVDAYFRRLAASLVPAFEDNYQAQTPSGRMWKSVAAGTPPVGWELVAPDGSPYGTTKRRRAGPPAVVVESSERVTGALEMLRAPPLPQAALPPWTAQPPSHPRPLLPAPVVPAAAQRAAGTNPAPLPDIACAGCGSRLTPTNPSQRRCRPCATLAHPQRTPKTGQGGQQGQLAQAPAVVTQPHPAADAPHSGATQRRRRAGRGGGGQPVL